MTAADRPLAAVMRCKAARRRPDICLPASQAIAASFGDTSPIMLGASVYSEESVATRRTATGARVGAAVGAGAAMGAVSAGPLKRGATYTHTANTDRSTAAAATVAPAMMATAAVVAVSAGGGGGGGNASGSFMRKQTRHAIISHAKKTRGVTTPRVSQRCQSSGPLGALLSSPALGVQLMTALQVSAPTNQASK